MSGRTVRLVLRSAVTAPIVSGFVVSVVALVAFLGAAAPALVHDARTATVQDALERIPPISRDLSGSTRGAPAVGNGTSAAAGRLDPALQGIWGRPIDGLDTARESFDLPLRDLLDDPRIVVVSDPAASVPETPRPLNAVTITFDPTYRQHVTFVSGSPPETVTVTDDLVTYEVALARSAADTLEWRVGETRRLRFPSGVPLALVLTGVYDANDEADAEWSHVPTGAQPTAVLGPMGDITQYATAYAAPEAVASTGQYADWFAIDSWLPLAVERIDGADAPELAAQLRASSGVQVPLSVVLQSRAALGLTLSSSAPAVLDAADRRANGMAQIVLFAAVGPFALAIVVLALAGRLLATRRAGPARLVAARGASTPLLIGVLAGEGIALGAVGAAIGAAVAAAVLGFEGVASLAVPIAVTVTPAVVLPWLTLAMAARRGRSDLGGPSRTPVARRVAVEVGIVVAAALVTVVAVTGPPGVDPVLLVVPLALAAAASVVALRVVPLVLGAVERRGRSTRGLVSLVGPARARRDPSVRAAPVLAVVLGVAVTLFAVSFWATVSTGIDTAADIDVGAELRLEAPYISEDQVEQIRALDGVAAVAALSSGSRVELNVEGRTIRAVAYAVDVDDLVAVQDASKIATLPTPGDLTDETGAHLPVVVSAELAAALRGQQATLADAPVDVRAVAEPTARPGTADTWLLVDEAVLPRLDAPAAGVGVTLIALTPGADAAAVTADVQSVAGPLARVSSPVTTAARLASDPALTAVSVALVAAAGVVALMLVLAVGMTLVLGAPGRGRLLALLAALGYPRRRGAPFVWWEVAPALLLALPFGVAVGLALPALTLPRLRLSVFLADVIEPAVRLGGWLPVLVVGGFVVLTMLAVLIAAAAASRITAVFAIRSSDEEG